MADGCWAPLPDILPLMSPILTSLLLGLTAAVSANAFGGAIIVQKHWERSYLRYFVALGAGFMLATTLVEMVLRQHSVARGHLPGFLFWADTCSSTSSSTPSLLIFTLEKRNPRRPVRSMLIKGYSVLIGLLIHTFFDGIAIASGFLVSRRWDG